MAEENKTSKKALKAEKKADSKKADKSKSAKKKSRKNPFKSIASFFKSVKSEGKKVVWATPKDVLRNTLIVLIVVAIAGVCIYAVDSVLSLGMKQIKNLAETTTISAEVDEDTDDTSTDTSTDESTDDTTDDTTEEATTEANE